MGTIEMNLLDLFKGNTFIFKPDKISSGFFSLAIEIIYEVL